MKEVFSLGGGGVLGAREGMDGHPKVVKANHFELRYLNLVSCVCFCISSGEHLMDSSKVI